MWDDLDLYYNTRALAGDQYKRNYLTDDLKITAMILR